MIGEDFRCHSCNAALTPTTPGSGVLYAVCGYCGAYNSFPNHRVSFSATPTTPYYIDGGVSLRPSPEISAWSSGREEPGKEEDEVGGIIDRVRRIIRDLGL